MKTRWGSLMFVVGIVLALSGLAGTAIGPRAAQATTTGCTPSSDLFGCNVSGTSGASGWGLQVWDGSTNHLAAISARSTAGSGTTAGLYGRADSTGGRGVVGNATATSGTNYGVYGNTASPGGYGVYGISTITSSSTGAGYGVYGESATFNSAGVRGLSTSSSGSGVYGSGRIGVNGFAGASDGYGILGIAGVTGAYAGYFSGNVQVNGTLSKSAGSFKIDHPLDPANKYLSHSFVESPDMMNIYNGNVTLDKSGQALVQMPAYFQALNQEFRYQLTALGAPGPNLFIASEIKNNQFTIAGGKPGMRVSWQVTGIRHDPYAEKNRIQVEQDKPAEERGTYLYPQGYGQPETKGRDYKQQQQIKERQPKRPTAPPAP